MHKAACHDGKIGRGGKMERLRGQKSPDRQNSDPASRAPLTTRTISMPASIGVVEDHIAVHREKTQSRRDTVASLAHPREPNQRFALLVDRIQKPIRRRGPSLAM